MATFNSAIGLQSFAAMIKPQLQQEPAKALAACNIVHAMDALGLNKARFKAPLPGKAALDGFHAELEELDGIVSQMGTPEAHFFATDLQAREDAIKALPIDRLGERQGMLVDLLVAIVDHETENGELTSKAGNTSLESMDWWSTLHTYASSCGFKRLGNGHFSAAYSHPMLLGKIIKVGFKKEDSGAAYVAFCRMHQGRVGIPVIHDVQRHASCYTVVMDHLEDAWSAVGEYQSSAYNEYYIARNGVSHGQLSDVKEAHEYTQRELDLAETAKEINKFFKGIARFDLHPGNVMLDKDDNIVITDPVSFSNDQKATEFQIDPEQLLIEIEQAAKAAMVARCKARKAKRSPEARAALKELVQRRKARQKENRERSLKHARVCALAPKWEDMRALLGTKHRANIWQFNRGEVLDRVGQQAIDKHVNALQACLVRGRNTLPMDERLDKQFLRG